MLFQVIIITQLFSEIDNVKIISEDILDDTKLDKMIISENGYCQITNSV